MRVTLENEDHTGIGSTGMVEDSEIVHGWQKNQAVMVKIQDMQMQ